MVFGLLLLASMQVPGPGKVRPVGEAFERVPGRKIATELVDSIVYASDPKTLEAELPRVLEATWRPTSSGGVKLERTPEQTRLVRAQGVATIRATLTKGLEPYTELRRAPFDVSLANRLIDGLGDVFVVGGLGFGPSGVADVLLQHLTAELAPRLENELPYQIPITYALAPTAAEHPFGPNARDRILAYPAIERALARQYLEGKGARQEEGWLGQLIPPGTRPGEEDAGVGRVSIIYYGDDRAIRWDMKAYRPDGSERIRVERECPAVRTPVRPFHPAGETDALPVAKDRSSLAASGGEPLEVEVVPALDALAARVGMPVVATIPDSAAVGFAKRSPATIGAALRAIEAEGIEFTVENGAVLGRPVDLMRFSRQNIARPALRRWTTAMRRSGVDWLRPWSRLYAESPQISPLASYLREIVLPAEGIPAADFGYSRWTYKLLGRLSDEEWNALMAGRPIRVGSDAVRRGMASIMANYLERGEEGVRLPDTALRGTFSFPYGVPASATLTMEGREQRVARNARFERWLEFVYFAGNSFAESGIRGEMTPELVERELAFQDKGSGDIEFGFRGVRVLTLSPGLNLFSREEQKGLDVRSEGPPAPFSKANEETRRVFLAAMAEGLASREKEAEARRP